MADEAAREALQTAVKHAVEGEKRSEISRDDADSFGKVRRAVAGIKKDSLALEGFLAEDMRSVLQLVRRRSSKKMYAGQGRECLSGLFESPSWLRVAQGEEDMMVAFKALCEGNAAMLERLDTPAAQLVLPSAKANGADEVAALRKAVAEAKSQREKMEQELRAGLAIMCDFGYTFPVDVVGTKVDRAMEAFSMFYDGMVRLENLSAKASPEDKVGAVLDSFAEADSEGLMNFLSTMYHCGSRRSMSARIKYVADKLQTHSASFRAAASTRGWDLLNPATPPLPPPVASLTAAAAVQSAVVAAPLPPPAAAEPPVRAAAEPLAPAVPVAPAARAAPAVAPAQAKSVVVWVDFNPKAYQNSHLENKHVKLIGFQDNEKNPAEWDNIQGGIGEIIANREAYLDVVICNRKHTSAVGDIAQLCQAERRDAPMLIVSTRDVSIPVSPVPGVNIKLCSDWREVEREAKSEVDRRRQTRET